MIRALTLLIAWACLASAPAMGAPLFEQFAVIEVELEGPMQKLIDQKKFPAERQFVLRAEGHEHRVGVQVRGKSRLTHCEFPPLRLNFDESAVDGSLFAGQDTLKLVTHCFNYDAGEGNAVREYAAYRILGMLTAHAYRVRLLNVSYIDNDGERRGRTWQRHAFVLEAQDRMAERVGARRVHSESVSLARLDDRQEAVVYLFQYLVGNTDWSLVKAHGDASCCHNGDLVAAGDTWYYVPYDFDQSGLVGARYARPDASLPIRSVSQRLYRGFCMDDPGVLAASLETIRGMEADILAVVRDLPGQSEKERQQALDFLSEFFQRASKPSRLLHEFEDKCLG